MKSVRLNCSLLLIFNSLVVYSQQSGVYVSVADFESGKLTYAVDCSKEKQAIQVHEFLGKEYITVIHHKESHKLLKKEVYGYRDCNGAVYRLGVDKHYRVMNPTEKILLYAIEMPWTKGQGAYTFYYFSRSAGDDIYDLTLENLKRAFPDNHKFHDALDAQFSSGLHLALYDSFHRMYKVNRLYLNSLENRD